MATRLADLGFEFPLFDALLSEAVTDDAGACVFCDAHASVRFEDACYHCFRAGKAQRVVGTEFGMVRPEDAERGWTHGMPGDPSEVIARGFEVALQPVDPEFPDEQWFEVRVDEDLLLELTRTPAYHSWQDETWLFCCGRPSVFIGAITEADLVGLDIREVYRAMDVPADDLRDALHNRDTYHYGFRCSQCSELHAYYEYS